MGGELAELKFTCKPVRPTELSPVTLVGTRGELAEVKFTENL